MSHSMAHLSTDTITKLYQQLDNRLPEKIRAQPVIENLLPAIDSDLSILRKTMIAPPDPYIPPPPKGRENICNHAENLRRKLSGQSELLYIHILSIAYLRRGTPFTDHAWALFRRIWAEEQDFLIKNLSPRFLVSALRTFADHSDNPAERLLGKLGFIYGTMIKIYESERIKEGHAPDQAQYLNLEKSPKIGVSGLGGVPFGRDNSLQIIQILLFEECRQSPLIGAIILALMTHIQRGDTVFSRVDRARIETAYKLNKPGAWSFGAKPSPR